MKNLGRTIALIVFAAALAKPASANLIVNGGFEDPGGAGSLTGWTFSGNVSVGTDPHSGSHEAALKGVGGGTPVPATLSQSFVIPTAGTYEVSFFLRNPALFPSANLSVSFDSATPLSLPGVFPTYFHLFFDADPSVASQTLTFATSGTGEFHIDDVSVQLIPEPATVGLLGAGLLGVAGVLRRRRKQL